MKLYHVVAVANRRVIGNKNQLPWHFSSDLKFFKELTGGSTVLMGRKTFESIGKPLPNRVNFVISRTQTGDKDSLRFFPSIEDAIREVKTERAFIIGGAHLYAQTLSLINGIYLSRIHADFEGDAFYPEIPGSFTQKSKKLLQEEPLIEAIEYVKEG